MINKINSKLPIIVKIAPDLTDNEMCDIAEVSMRKNVIKLIYYTTKNHHFLVILNFKLAARKPNPDALSLFNNKNSTTDISGGSNYIFHYYDLIEQTRSILFNEITAQYMGSHEDKSENICIDSKWAVISLTNDNKARILNIDSVFEQKLLGNTEMCYLVTKI